MGYPWECAVCLLFREVFDRFHHRDHPQDGDFLEKLGLPRVPSSYFLDGIVPKKNHPFWG